MTLVLNLCVDYGGEVGGGSGSFSETNNFSVKTQHTANQKKYLFAYEHEVDNHNAKVIMVMVLMTNQPN